MASTGVFSAGTLKNESGLYPSCLLRSDQGNPHVSGFSGSGSVCTRPNLFGLADLTDA
jgi:hypothetical protein